MLSMIDNDPRLLHPSHRVAPFFARTILYLTVPYLHLLPLLSNHLINGAQKPLARVLSLLHPHLSLNLSLIASVTSLIHKSSSTLLYLHSSPITPSLLPPNSSATPLHQLLPFSFFSRRSGAGVCLCGPSSFSTEQSLFSSLPPSSHPWWKYTPTPHPASKRK